MTQVWGRYAAVVLLSSVCLVGMAQETKSKRSTKLAGKPVAAKQQRVTGRLPRHFASLVDDQQCAEIYAIQAAFQEKITVLEKELAALEAEQMKEVEGVLTATQQKELIELRKQGATRSRTAKSKTTSDSTNGSSKSRAVSSKTTAKKGSTTKPASSKATVSKQDERR